jgi:hypothetical protein
MCSKAIKFLGVAVGGLLLTQSLAKADIVSTIENAKSGTTVSTSGTYTVTVEIKVPSGVTVAGPSTFNFTTTDKTTAGFYCDGGSNQQLISLTVTGANHAIYVEASGVKITNCITHNNWNTGIQVSDSSGENCTISGCTSYDNVDQESGGGNADGIDVKAGSGSGNTVTNCTCYDNSDDGYDVEKATAPVTFSGDVSHNEGSYDGFQGNGNGIKMGIGGDDIAHSYTSCTAYDNTAGNSPHGFSTNGNTGKIKLTKCHSYGNTDNDELGNCVLSSCTMQT